MDERDSSDLDMALDQLAKLGGMGRKLRQLLLEIYISGSLWVNDLNDPNYAAGEAERLYDTVLAASEGRSFEPLGLPFPRAKP